MMLALSPTMFPHPFQGGAANCSACGANATRAIHDLGFAKQRGYWWPTTERENRKPVSSSHDQHFDGTAPSP